MRSGLKCLAPLLLLAAASCTTTQVILYDGRRFGPPAEPVEVAEHTVTRRVTYQDGREAEDVKFRRIVMENEYLRVSVLPELGGRVEEVLDKTTGQSVFLKEPILWPKTKYTAYGSQLGGIEVNFPCFHHGNSYLDRWNWLTRNERDGSAVIVLGWTEPDSRQRIVHTLRLRAGEAVLHSHYRFANLNGRPWGFAPWTNTFFGYHQDLQYIIPTRWVAPHGFNHNTLDLLPWPWPEFDQKSVCFWRNVTDQYNSVFAYALEGDFHGVYRHEADRGMVRTFDRRRLPGVKLYNVPPHRLKTKKQPAGVPYLEIWTSPALLHEDPLWWEAWAVRQYDEAYYPVHGIGGYRYANAHGAVNLTRGEKQVTFAVCVTRPRPDAVVSLAGMDGDWWRGVVDLAPDRPFRKTLPRAPGREPLTVTVCDATRGPLIEYTDRPDPDPRATFEFAGKAMWLATPLSAARKAELYHALWRGPTGGYGDFGAPGIRAYRNLLKGDPENVEALLGLARSLMLDLQMRLPGRPRVDAAQLDKLKAEQAAEADAVLNDVIQLAPDDPRAPTLAGLLRWHAEDAAGAAEMFARAPDYPRAQVGLAMAMAAQGRSGEAIEVARRAAAAFPDSAPVQQVAAGAALLGGDAREALARLSWLREDDPLDAVTLWLMAAACRAAGGEAEALALEDELKRLAAQTGATPCPAGELKRLGLGRLLPEGSPEASR